MTLWTNRCQYLQSFTCFGFLQRFFSLRHRDIPWALNLEKLSGSVLCFLSVASMRRRLFCLYACDFSGKDGWKKLDRDVRPTFHLEEGYPLSKHSWRMNQTDRLRGVWLFFLRDWWCMRGLPMWLLLLLRTKRYLFLFHLCRFMCFVMNWTGKRLHGWVARPSVCPLGWLFGVVYGQWLTVGTGALCTCMGQLSWVVSILQPATEATDLQLCCLLDPH